MKAWAMANKQCRRILNFHRAGSQRLRSLSRELVGYCDMHVSTPGSTRHPVDFQEACGV
jgi:hypothetical protein